MLLIYLPVKLIHVKNQAMATLRNQPLDWEGAGTVTSYCPEHCREKLRLLTLQDASPSNQEIKGQVTKAAKEQPSQLQCICHFCLFHPTSSFTNRTDVFWKLKFGLQINKSASVSVKCIPYLIITAITVTEIAIPIARLNQALHRAISNVWRLLPTRFATHLGTAAGEQQEW